MSYERALKAVNLEPTDKIPQVEWVSPMSEEAIRVLTGLDPYTQTQEAFLKLFEVLDLDFSWGGLPSGVGTYKWEKDESSKELSPEIHITQWGIHASSWRESGAHLQPHKFNSVEEVLHYKPAAYEPRSVEQIAEEFNYSHGENQRMLGKQALVAEGYYTTLFHWGIAIFGWEMYMLAAASAPTEFASLIEQFAELSAKYVEAWSLVEDLKVFISHDDLCMTKGPVFHPDWYRQYIFPWYPQIWKPIKERGIKIVFCSDGNITEFVDDLFSAGANGLIFEPLVDLKWLAEKYGKTKILIGNVDTKILTLGTEEDVRNEVKRCVETAKHCPGFFLNASGQLTHNIPLNNLLAYIEACREMRKRG